MQRFRTRSRLRSFYSDSVIRSLNPILWYDPSDLSTLFQDSAGTTPVTAVNGPVGLILDKSQGLGLGSDDVTNGDNVASLFFTTTGPTATRGTVARSIDLDVPAAKFSGTTSGATYINPFGSTMVSAGRAIKITYRVYIPSSWTGSGIKVVDTNDGSYAAAAVTTRDEWVSISYIRPAKSTAWALGIGDPNVVDHTGQSFYVTDLSIKTLAGNHASQATAINRPTLAQDANGKYYLAFNGTNTSLATSAIDLSGTNKLTMIAGINKTSDALFNPAVEFSANSDTTAGAFGLFAPSSAGQAIYMVTHRGASANAGVTVSGVSAPNTSVIAMTSNLGGPLISVRRNGSPAGSSVGSTGGGNFGNHVLYLGKRGSTGSYFNGRLYGLIIRGADSTTAEIEMMEQYMNFKSASY